MVTDTQIYPGLHGHCMDVADSSSMHAHNKGEISSSSIILGIRLLLSNLTSNWPSWHKTLSEISKLSHKRIDKVAIGCNWQLSQANFWNICSETVEVWYQTSSSQNVLNWSKLKVWFWIHDNDQLTHRFPVFQQSESSSATSNQWPVASPRTWNSQASGRLRWKGQWKVARNCHLGVSENRLVPHFPNGFADHYPYEKWLFHWEY